MICLPFQFVSIHTTGFDAFSFDPHKFAMDYHSIGFRECTTEAGRYLIEREGMDLQDPLRLRLLSHLQCYAAQRELSLKASAHPTAWNPSAFTTPHQFATPSIPAPSQSALNSSHSSTDSYWNPPSMSSSATSSSMDHHHHPHHQMSMSHGHMMPPPSSLIKSSPCSSPASSSACPSSSSMSNHLYSSASLSTASGHQYFPPGYGHVVPASSGQINGSSASVKQFRPWGGELVYWLSWWGSHQEYNQMMSTFYRLGKLFSIIITFDI